MQGRENNSMRTIELEQKEKNPALENLENAAFFSLSERLKSWQGKAGCKIVTAAPTAMWKIFWALSNLMKSKNFPKVFTSYMKIYFNLHSLQVYYIVQISLTHPDDCPVLAHLTAECQADLEPLTGNIKEGFLNHEKKMGCFPFLICSEKLIKR